MSPAQTIPCMLLALTLCACGDKDDGQATDDTASGEDSGGGEGSLAAELAELSSGDCPDLTESGTKTFTSSDMDRNVHVVIPSSPGTDMPVVFFFHGLVDTSIEPASYFANAFDMQDLADETGAVIVLPESQVMELMGFSFYMWDAMEEGPEDVVLYDDLRTCVATELDVDIERFAVMGFSGGALFTTTIARERGDTLSAVVGMSGGSDAEVPIFDAPVARYDTPAYAMPVMLTSGGSGDVWPGGGLTVIDFEAATDTLEGQLEADGHFVVRCSHDQGHTITTQLYSLAEDFALAHRMGEASPYAGELAGDLPDNCEASE